jgi:oxygen-dependent protoporphyrinogen oxidase
MSKQIIIIGGGISGLAVLHYLKKKYRERPDVRIRLWEKNDYLGGTIRTLHDDRCLFETGPNGFLDSKNITLEFIRELGLENDLLPAGRQAQKRFISRNGKLHELPGDVTSFLKFQPLSTGAKFRVLAELVVPKGNNPDETVYEFGCRRVGREFTEIFLDSMASGIFAGDARRLNLRAAFPKIYDIEQRYGSLFKGMMALAKAGKKTAQKGAGIGHPGGRLTSFPQGMSQLIRTLHNRYEEDIQTGHPVFELHPQESGFHLRTTAHDVFAGEVYLCAPAYQAAPLVRRWKPALAKLLSAISYAPVTVVGLLYQRSQLSKLPEGFGYLIPSSEKKNVLGVLFPSNIFTNRSKEDEFLFRVMIGGARHPDIRQKSEEQLIRMAEDEISGTFSPTGDAKKVFFATWPQAIPQYDQDYPALRAQIESEVAGIRNLHLVANYLGGISINDCIASAKAAVEISGDSR